MNKTTVTENDIIGWLIYRPDTEEFVHSLKDTPEFTSTFYTTEPCFAFQYETEEIAFRASTAIDKPTEVVPLFDIGDKLAVGFSEPH